MMNEIEKTEDHEWMDGDKLINEHPLMKLYVQHLCINCTP